MNKFANIEWERLWKVLWITAVGVTQGAARTFDCGLSAEDLVGETLLDFWKSLNGLGWNPAKANIEVFLAGVLRKKAMTHFRRQKFVVGSVDDTNSPFSQTPAPEPAEEGERSLWDDLDRLVAGNRSLEDLTVAARMRAGGPNVNQEIGELMDKTPSQVSKLKIKLLALPGVKELLNGKQQIAARS